MTRLAAALERVADAIEQHDASSSPPTPEPMRKLDASTLLLATPGIGPLLRENFRPVPAEQVQLAGDQLAVTCQCGREHVLGFGDLVRCSCWRFFLNLRTLKVSTPADPTDVVFCDDCGDDVAVKDGDWIRVDGADRFLCADCHAHAVAAGDVDLFGGAA